MEETTENNTKFTQLRTERFTFKIYAKYLHESHKF